MPTYSPDEQAYRERVHRNGRDVDPNFDPGERLFRRHPKAALFNGKPVPLTMLSMDSEVSTNRSKYSEPQDVLEPDCCDGNARSGYVVLDIHVSDVPEMIPAQDGTRRVFRFRVVHKPKDTCFAHTEIRCNQHGDIGKPHEEPPKHVRDIFRAEIARHLANRDVLEFAQLRPGLPD